MNRIAFLSPCLALFLTPSIRCQTPVQSVSPQSRSPQSDAAQQINDRIAQLAAASAMTPAGYTIGKGDLLSVEVFEVPEISRDVRVNDSGQIGLPLVPVKVQAAGRTPSQLQDDISDLLKSNGLVSKPQVTVNVKELRSAPIMIIGAVAKPTVIQASRPMTLLEVLSEVGGVTPDAGSQIIISRTAPPSATADGATPAAGGGTTTITVDLNTLIDSGDSRYNIPMMAGDVVRVPRSGVIYVVGAVGHPGGFVMQTDRQQLTVLKAMSLAGGLAPTAKADHAVIVRKDGVTGKQEEVAVDINKILKLKTEDVSLRQSDILYVPDSAGKRALKRTGDVAVSLISGVALVKATSF